MLIPLSSASIVANQLILDEGKCDYKTRVLLEELECDLRTQQQVVAQSVAIYNELRPHLSCGMLTPNQMHCQCKKEIVTYRTKNDNTARCVVI